MAGSLPFSHPSPLRLLLEVSLRSHWRRMLRLRQESRTMTAFMLLFLAGYLVVSYGLFESALRFVGRFPGVGTLLLDPLMYLLFAFLFILLLISNLIIGYTNLFRNREASFLLTQPVPFQTVFQWKLLESSVLASWAFLLLLVPFLAAYGRTQNAVWHFYPVSAALVLLFIVLPGVAGCAGAVVVARYLDRRVFQVLALIGIVALIVMAALWYRSGPPPEDLPGGRMVAVMEKMLRRTQFAQHPLLPSYWLTSSVLRWAEGALAAAGFFMAVLLSNALFLGTVVCTHLGGFFYRAAAETQGRASVFGRWAWARRQQKRDHASLFAISRTEQWLQRIPGLAPEVRAIVLKDARMFWRDTTQWVQTLMLFGLLAVYIFNIRFFSQQLTSAFWVHLVAFLNLAACSLNLATLTTRFVFPQFSLEGRRLWIVGMAPLGLIRVVWIKFWVATVLCLLLTVTLILMSCLSLGFSPLKTLLFCLAMVVITFTLNGMAVGLGALHPNFREEHPSKIVSGFGGTLCLILSFVYILAAVMLLGLTVAWQGSMDPRPARLLFACGGFLALSALLGAGSLKLGLDKVRNLEV